MKSARLTSFVLMLTLIGSLSGLAALHTPKAHPKAAALVRTPLVVAPQVIATERASRSRPVATLPPKAVEKHFVHKVTTPLPVIHRSKQPTTRRVVRASHYGGVHDITMYCGGGITASGKHVYEGEVATLDRSIPFGTVVQIEGMGSYVVEDRIGHGSEFDIYTSSCSHANEFGRHHLRVTF